LSIPRQACRRRLIFAMCVGWALLCSSPMCGGITTSWCRPRWRFLALLLFRISSMVVKRGFWCKHKGIGWRSRTKVVWGGFWGSTSLTATTLNIWGVGAMYPLWDDFWPEKGCCGWGTWLRCLRRGTHIRRYSHVCMVPNILRAALPSPLSPQCARTFRELAYHSHKGVGMSALRTTFSGRLASRSCSLGRVLRCPFDNSFSSLVDCRFKHKLPL
jgi:hypothetical protein